MSTTTSNSTTSNSPTPAIYVRLSKEDKVNETTSIDLQKRRCLDFIRGKGWPIPPDHHIFTDDGISAFSGRSRPAYDQMMEAVAAGDITIIVTAKLDRIYRQISGFGKFLDTLTSHDARFVTVDDGIDTTTDMGWAQANLMMVVAEMESRNTRKRVNSRVQHCRANNIPYGGHRPFGQENRSSKSRQISDQQLAAERSAIVHIADQLTNHDATLYSCAEYLNSKGITTTDGNTWTGATLKRSLLHPSIMGHMTNGPTTLPCEHYTAILDEATYRKLSAALATKRRGTNKVAHLLSGILTCGKCAGPMYVRKRKHKYGHYLTYYCQRSPKRNTCGANNIKYDTVNDRVTATIGQLLEGDILERLYGIGNADTTDHTTTETKLAISTLEKRKRSYASLAAAGNITPENYAAVTTEVDSQIADLEATLTRSMIKTSFETVIHPDLDWFDSLSLEQQRDVVTLTTDSIVISESTERGIRDEETNVARIAITERTPDTIDTETLLIASRAARLLGTE